ncbi:MAG: hypothetical protein ACRDXB_12770 [Actinomycetes bacterium]
MTEYVMSAFADTDPGGFTEAPIPSARRVDLPCESFLPGHHMHWAHWNQAKESASHPVRRVRVDGFRIELVLDDDSKLSWRHHDPVRLSRVLEAVPGTVVAFTDLHALRVGTYWFNCATTSSRWQPCRRMPAS